MLPELVALPPEMDTLPHAQWCRRVEEILEGLGCRLVQGDVVQESFFFQKIGSTPTTIGRILARWKAEFDISPNHLRPAKYTLAPRMAMLCVVGGLPFDMFAVVPNQKERMLLRLSTPSDAQILWYLKDLRAQHVQGRAVEVPSVHQHDRTERSGWNKNS